MPCQPIPTVSFQVARFSQMQNAGLCTHDLIREMDDPLILLRTTNPSNGLFNGTRCILLQARPRVLENMAAHFLTTKPWFNAWRLTLIEDDLPFVLRALLMEKKNDPKTDVAYFLLDFALATSYGEI